MASIRSYPKSRYWYACFSIPGADGRLKQIQQTTKEVDRRKALEIARKLEAAARTRLTEAQAHKSIADLYAVVNPGDTLPGSSVRDWFTSWANNKAIETAPSTASNYQRTADHFINSLGKRADLPVNSLSVRDVLSFRNARAQRVSVSSANTDLKIVRMVLKDALAAGLCLTNVAIGVKPAKSSEPKNERRPFTLSELRRIYRQAQGEWRGIFLVGLYTGARLRDCARLTWQNVDLDRRELNFVSRKKKRHQSVWIHSKLLDFLLTLPAGDDPKAPLFPKAAAVKNTGTLSHQFYDIMARARLVEKRKHRKQKKGKGRDARRQFNEICFHALRHSATSLMKNAKASAAAVMDIVGHDSAAASLIYTHADEPSKRAAIESLPDITTE
jgi:integrase